MNVHNLPLTLKRKPQPTSPLAWGSVELYPGLLPYCTQLGQAPLSEFINITLRFFTPENPDTANVTLGCRNRDIQLSSNLPGPGAAQHHLSDRLQA